MLTLFRHRVESVGVREPFPLPLGYSSVCRLATGRSALFHLLQRMQAMPDPPVRVLMPAYVAEGVIQPFRSGDFDIEFYHLKQDLTPDLMNLQELLLRGSGRSLVVLVHFFGFPARSPELTQLVHQHGGILLDDLAHAPLSRDVDGRLLGESSELALYSLNKFLPVVDGAILLSWLSELDVSVSDVSTLPELPEVAQQAYGDHLAAAGQLAVDVDADAVQRDLRALGTAYESYYREINSDLSLRRQSTMSAQLEQAFPYRHMISQRCSNARMVYQGLRCGVFSLVYPMLPEGVVPFCIPVRVAPNHRSRVVKAMMARGILLSTLQDKWNFIPPGREADFEFEYAFLDEHLLIPISEFISAEQTQYLLEQLNQI